MQIGYPTGTLVTGTWTNESGGNSLLHASVGDNPPLDTTYIKSAVSPINDLVKFSLNSVGRFSPGNFVIKFRGYKNGVFNPNEISFNASLDHDTLVTSYECRFYGIAGLIGPSGIQYLGKPTPVAGVITVALNLTAFPKSTGIQYVAYVVAIGSAGESEAGISNPFMVV